MVRKTDSKIWPALCWLGIVAVTVLSFLSLVSCGGGDEPPPKENEPKKFESNMPLPTSGPQIPAN